MDTKTIKKINFTLSAQNITPYDLLLALDKKDLVPNDIIINRQARVLGRDGKETPEGYIKNAIEDLNKLNFKNKNQILSVLQQQSKTLSGFNDETAQMQKLHCIYLIIPIAVIMVLLLRS